MKAKYENEVDPYEKAMSYENLSENLEDLVVAINNAGQRQIGGAISRTCACVRVHMCLRVCMCLCVCAFACVCGSADACSCVWPRVSACV